MVLLAQTDLILSWTTPLAMAYILNPSFDSKFIVWHRQDADSGFQNSAAVKEIASIMQAGLEFSNFYCHNCLRLTGVGYSHFSKLRSTSLVA